MDFSELIAAADPSIFTESIKAWVSGLNINSVIMLIMMIFMIVGAIDRIRGNKLGYGEKFEDGFNAIGGLAIAMAGVYAAAPVLSMVLGPIISPIYTAIAPMPLCSPPPFWPATWAATLWLWSWPATPPSVTSPA